MNTDVYRNRTGPCRVSRRGGSPRISRVRPTVRRNNLDPSWFGGTLDGLDPVRMPNVVPFALVIVSVWTSSPTQCTLAFMGQPPVVALHFGVESNDFVRLAGTVPDTSATSIMKTPLLSIAYFVIAALLGAVGQFLYKSGAEKAVNSWASYLNARILTGVVCYVAVMVLFVAAFKRGASLAVLYPIYASTFIWARYCQDSCSDDDQAASFSCMIPSTNL